MDEPRARARRGSRVEGRGCRVHAQERLRVGERWEGRIREPYSPFTLNPRPSHSTLLLSDFFRPALFDHASVEEVDRTIGVRSVARIVRDHADGRAAAM